MKDLYYFNYDADRYELDLGVVAEIRDGKYKKGFKFRHLVIYFRNDMFEVPVDDSFRVAGKDLDRVLDVAMQRN